jgi:hypothetical protein
VPASPAPEPGPAATPDQKQVALDALLAPRLQSEKQYRDQQREVLRHLIEENYSPDEARERLQRGGLHKQNATPYVNLVKHPEVARQFLERGLTWDQAHEQIKCVSNGPKRSPEQLLRRDARLIVRLLVAQRLTEQAHPLGRFVIEPKQPVTQTATLTPKS